MEPNRYINVLFKAPNKNPKIVRIENALDDMQELIHGPLDIMFYKGAFLVCNKYRGTQNLEPNLSLENKMILGSFFIVGDDEKTADFISLSRKQIRKFTKGILISMDRQKEILDELECELE